MIEPDFEPKESELFWIMRTVTTGIFIALYFIRGCLINFLNPYYNP